MTELEASSIHVWRVDVDSPPLSLATLASCLDADEQARARRFHRSADTARYVTSHAVLRCLLSRYTGLAPAAHRFVTGEHGKPSLLDAAGPAFNLSHSGRWALCALSRDVAPGVDVEQPRDTHDLRAIAHRWFTANECAALERLHGEQYNACFRTLWVCKEALLKSDGGGIASGLARFELALDDHGVADSVRLARVDGDCQRASRWTLRTFGLDGGYPAAVAAPEPNLHVIQHVITPDELLEVMNQCR